MKQQSGTRQELAELLNRPKTKYRNEPVVMNNIRFDSQLEANRYAELYRMEKAGLITGLTVHPRFSLEVNGVLICTFITDFSYQVVRDPICTLIVEDVKALDKRTKKHISTPVYKLKKKLMKAVHGILIKEWPESDG